MRTDQKNHQRFNIRGAPLERLLLLAEQHDQNPHKILMNLIMDAPLVATEKYNENKNQADTKH